MTPRKRELRRLAYSEFQCTFAGAYFLLLLVTDFLFVADNHRKSLSERPPQWFSDKYSEFPRFLLIFFKNSSGALKSMFVLRFFSPSLPLSGPLSL